ncbi:hypothetical protein JI435_423510 [Parastagonospora nodorum SN15]|uniref:Uncharacterized protein n=1 Tax=Phaeosphaeria nodorum (strain SN15 / ATCC MYA-4574 / FGSC 10173) TaxID=321614 RepID=A0A7U2IB91_PHANO|nr:hypothetical protein JI435_423510 [Parastagonospora nodorum SN15]
MYNMHDFDQARQNQRTSSFIPLVGSKVPSQTRNVIGHVSVVEVGDHANVVVVH